MKKGNELARKLISIVASVALVVGLMPLPAFAAYDDGESGIPASNGAVPSAVGAASGESPSAADTTSGEGTPLTIGSPTRDMQPGTVTSWRELKTEINRNPIIQLGCDVVDTDNEGCIEVASGRTVTLDLNGHTLNRNLIKVSDSGSVIKVCDGAMLQIVDDGGSGTGKIVGGAAEQGGGVFVEAGGFLIFSGGIIGANSASLQGGGIYAAGTVTMTGGAIAENKRPVAGGTINGIPMAGGGIYIAEGGVLNFDGGVISKNGADEDGGGIYVNGILKTSRVDVDGGTVTGNTAGWTGGGIYVGDHGRIQLSGATISDNTAHKTGGGLNVHLKQESGSLKNCTITGNTSKSHGGGLRLLATNNYKLTIENTTIDNNTASGDGGGIYLAEGEIEMRGGCSVSDNTASDGGGGVKVYKGTTFTATDAIINNNKAKSEEGGGITSYGTTTLENCTISKNSSKKEGGGVYNDHNGSNTGNLALDNCKVFENTSGSDGGGVYSNRALSLLGAGEGSSSTCEIYQNTASGRGGGLFIDKDSDAVDIKGAIIIQDNKGAYGKDVYLRKDKLLNLIDKIYGTNIGFVEMEEIGVFTEGYSVAHNEDPHTFFGTDLGAIPVVWSGYRKEAQLKSDWRDMQGLINGTDNYGTVIVDKDYTACEEDVALEIPNNKHLTINLNGHTLNRNRAEKADGGCVIKVNSGAELTVVDQKIAGAGEGPGTITGGWSKDDGGGIYVDAGAVLDFQGGAIAGSKAVAGGGVYVKGTLKMSRDFMSNDGVAVTGNHADCGGGIFVSEEGTFIFDDGTISKNTAEDGGGIGAAGILKSSDTDVAGGTIEDNVASDTGGGIYVGGRGTIQLSKATIAGNTATMCGGGIYLAADNNPMGGNGSSSNNTVSGDGGSNALLTDSGSYIEMCTVTGNEAKEEGGGLCMAASNKTLTIENTTIDKNMAGAAGGIYLQNGNITISGNSSVSSNVASGGGGVYVAGFSIFEAYDLTIDSNVSSDAEGGGIANYGKTTLMRCTITRNKAKKEGGGVYNIDDLWDGGHLTLEGCTIAGNISGKFGGGVYSNKKLAIRDTAIGACELADGTTIPGNKATEKGGGVFIGSDSENTEIAGSLSVEGNTAGDFGNDVYLRSGVLECTGQLSETGKIGVDLEKGTGVLTKGYKSQNNKDPQVCFVVAAGYGTIVNDDGEVEITSGWKSMRKDIEGWSGDTYTLSQDYAAAPSDKSIAIQSGKSIIVDLNGHTLNRNCDGKTRNGQVFEVYDGATLTIVDRSSDNSGKITGGWSGYGGGIYVHEGGTLNFEGGTICGNKATDGGGGIYVAGTLNMKADSKSPNKNGGVVESNKTQASGGGIYLVGSGVLNFEVGTVTKNAADERGGGIMAKKGTTISVEGSPVVKGNDASLGGNDIYLPSGNKITVSGTLDEGAHVSAAIEDDWGVFTSGYDSTNNGKDPAAFFVSSEGFSVIKTDGEAAFDKNRFGETDYEFAFIYWSSQMNADEDTLNGHNWMSGISGERYLNEINMPGSHDAGMKNVIALGWCEDETATWTYWAPDIGAYFATTQVEYINQQLDEGARQLDLRLNNSKKVKMEGEYHWWDDGVNLWINHGTDSAAGTYTASGPDDELLSFDQVLIWVKDFLRKHPTETVILNIRPETCVPGQGDAIQARAKDIIDASLREINPSTQEAYLYKEPGSDNYYAPYTHIPQLKDCRGKVVLLPGSDSFVKVVGGFTAKSMTDYTDPTDYDNTATQQIATVEREYPRLNPGLDSAPLSSDASQMLDADSKAFLWYWELNCTGEDQGTWNYIAGLLKAFKWTEKLEKWLIGSTQLGDNPIKLAERVNPSLIGDGNLLGSDLTGQYIGWVRLDYFTAEYAEPIWRTNYFDDLQYCTVTVESALDDPNYSAQTYRLLKGTTITLPGNIYKNLPDGKHFDCWEITAGTHTGASYQKKDTFTIDGDVTFTAKWKKETPVEIVWRDAEDVDKLRPHSVDFTVTTRDGDASATSTSTLTLTDEQGWIGDAEGDISSIDPNWDLITDGTYTFSKQYEQGSGYTFEFVHTPNKTISTAGVVKWRDDDDADGMRPSEVTIHLVADGVEMGSATATEEGGWKFDFGEKPQYDSGRPIDYRVYEDRDGEWAQAYSTVVDDFIVLNTHTPRGRATMKATGAVAWDDAENARLTRPEWVVVTLWAGDTEVSSLKVKPGDDGYWMFDFGEVPIYDSDRQPIEYTVTEAVVPGYDGPFVIPDVASQGNCTFVVNNTLIVPEQDKDPSGIRQAPTPKALTYNGEAQELVKRGYCSGGMMMYALGEDGSTAPDLDEFGPALPVGTDAGTYYVWYYVKGDAIHTDTEPPECVTSTIAPRSVVFTGVSESEVYAGSEIEIADVDVDGLVSGHVHNVAFSAKGTDVGEYAGTITAANDVVIKSDVGEGAPDVTANYEITTTPGELVITRAKATITAKDQNFVYNGQTQGEGDTTYANPDEITKKITVEGLRGSDTIVNVTIDGQGQKAGEYQLTPSAAASSRASDGKDNYTFEYVTGTLTIEPAKATITVDSASKVQGEADPVFTGTVEGLIDAGDLGEITYSRIGGDQAPGVYKGVLSAAYTANPNYDVTVKPGDFTIKALFTVIWLDGDGSVLQKKTYVEGTTPPSYDGKEPTKAATAQYTYTFTGWDDGTVDGETTTYRPLFAETVKTGTLIFDCSGGTIDGKTSLTIEADVGDVITIPEAPVREGYTFKYWKGSEYYPGDKYTVEGDHAFTAVWEKKSDGAGAKGTSPATGDPFAWAVAPLAIAAACALLLAVLAFRRRVQRK